jgi:hypothetical protein
MIRYATMKLSTTINSVWVSSTIAIVNAISDVIEIYFVILNPNKLGTVIK